MNKKNNNKKLYIYTSVTTGFRVGVAVRLSSHLSFMLCMWWGILAARIIKFPDKRFTPHTTPPPLFGRDPLPPLPQPSPAFARILLIPVCNSVSVDLFSLYMDARSSLQGRECRLLPCPFKALSLLFLFVRRSLSPPTIPLPPSSQSRPSCSFSQPAVVESLCLVRLLEPDQLQKKK